MRNTHCLHCGKSFDGIRFNVARRKFCGNSCRAAFQRARAPERFWANVDKGPHPKGCWIWKGYCQKFGHGWLGRYGLAHRYAWTLLVGPLPDDVCLLHRCDNPPCVNPEHCFVGNRTINNADKVSKGRQAKGEDYRVRAKLRTEDVLEIRRQFVRLYANKSNIPALAKRYGVYPGTIRDVVLRLSWAHLP